MCVQACICACIAFVKVMLFFCRAPPQSCKTHLAFSASAWVELYTAPQSEGARSTLECSLRLFAIAPIAPRSARSTGTKSAMLPRVAVNAYACVSPWRSGPSALQIFAPAQLCRRMARASMYTNSMLHNVPAVCVRVLQASAVRVCTDARLSVAVGADGLNPHARTQPKVDRRRRTRPFTQRCRSTEA